MSYTVCMVICFYEGVSIGGKIPTAMTLLKVASAGTHTAQIPIVHVKTGQSKSFSLHQGSPIKFAIFLYFYPRLAIANPAVGRFSTSTLTEAKKLSFKITFEGAVRFYIGFIVVLSGYASCFNIFAYFARK